MTSGSALASTPDTVAGDLADRALGATPATTTPGRASATTILIAGDIATCDGDADADTATLIAGLPGTVMTAGDNAYPSGSPADFANCYAPTWGAFLDRTRPALGNHDWVTAGRAGYFGYFGSRAGPAGRGWYRFDAGTWRIYVLDSTRCWRPSAGAASGCAAGSPQYRWLKADLVAHPHACVMAVWHHPRFSSWRHGSTTAPRPLLRLLYRKGAELVVNGHDHAYERFSPATPDGMPDLNHGIRQIIAGTGGAPLHVFGQTLAPNSVFRDDTHHGVLRLDLATYGYTWTFLQAPDGQTLDSGTGGCHGRPG